MYQVIVSNVYNGRYKVHQFKSVSHFYRWFTTTYGPPPKPYRKWLKVPSFINGRNLWSIYDYNTPPTQVVDHT